MASTGSQQNVGGALVYLCLTCVVLFTAFAPGPVLARRQQVVGGAESVPGSVEDAHKEREDRRALDDAGVPLDSRSLAAAMLRNDLAVAVAAIRYAPRVQKTPELLAGLMQVVDVAPVGAALMALEALHKMGEVAWVPVAVGRMQAETDPRSRFTLAMGLARSGRGDGWYVVRESLLADGLLALDAANQVDQFHGLRVGGSTVDVFAEISAIRAIVKDERVIQSLDFALLRLRNRAATVGK